MATTPQRVQQKFQEAKEKQLKELDLSKQNLPEVPTELFNLECLEVVNLSDNKLTQIPEAIINLQNLTTLDLRENPIENL